MVEKLEKFREAFEKCRFEEIIPTNIDNIIFCIDKIQ